MPRSQPQLRNTVKQLHLEDRCHHASIACLKLTTGISMGPAHRAYRVLCPGAMLCIVFWHGLRCGLLHCLTAQLLVAIPAFIKGKAKAVVTQTLLAMVQAQVLGGGDIQYTPMTCSLTDKIATHSGISASNQQGKETSYVPGVSPWYSSVCSDCSLSFSPSLSSSRLPGLQRTSCIDTNLRP